MHHIQIRNCLQIGLVPAIQESICSIPHPNTLCATVPYLRKTLRSSFYHKKSYGTRFYLWKQEF